MYSIQVFIFALAASAALGQEDICTGGAEFWPHPNCTQYYQCNNGNPIIGLCPGELFWNPKIDACDFPNNVQECVGGTRPPTGTTTQATTTAPPTTTQATTTAPPTTTQATTTTPTTQATTTTPTTQATTTRPITTTEETPETEGTGSPVTTTKLPPGVCPPTNITKIPHPERCELYYLCVEGVRQEPPSQCAEGLWFDPIISECNLQSVVSCTPVTTTPATTSTRPNLPECPDTGFVYLPYPGNCTLYIICLDGVPILYRCQDGYHFNPEAEECQPESIANCKDIHFEESAQDNNDDKLVHVQSNRYWNYVKNFVDFSAKKFGLSKLNN